MPWVVAAAVAGAATSSYLGKKSDSGSNNGGTPGGNAPPVYQPTDQPGRDQNFLTSENQYQSSLYNQQGATAPQNDRLLQGQMSNPAYGYTTYDSGLATDQYLANANAAAQSAGQGYTYANQQFANSQASSEMMRAYFPTVQNSVTALQNQAGQSQNTYNNLMGYQQAQQGNVSGSAQNLYNAGNQALQTANDPQNALYAQQFQQNTDQTRVAEAARGIQASPYGAAVENNANQNFNTNWQNQQLARQAQGIQSAQNAYGSAEGLNNNYTTAQAGLQAGQNEQYSALQGAAQNEYLGYVNATNQTNAANTQNIGGAQQNAYNLANQAAASAYQGGQTTFNTNQQIYGAQNQSLGNYQANNQPFFQGLNQLQSNDLSYMNYGQGAQNQAFGQNQQNNLNNQQAISSIAGPLTQSLQNTNWGNIFGSSPNYNNASYGYGDTSAYTNYAPTALANGGWGIE